MFGRTFLNQEAANCSRSTVTGDEQFSEESLDFQLTESHRVLDKQIQQVENTDEKALRTVRIGVLLLGIVLSVTNFSSVERFANAVTITGSTAIAASIVTGVFTYSGSDPYYGPGPDVVEEFLARNPGGRTWKRAVLDGYAHWIEYNREINADDAAWLFRTQVLLAGGVLLVVLGIGIHL